ncbi:class I SAM-dependent methyltransferase [Nocardioides donggukensis]|uniref:Class I SAM-dependent methyltransferase n=1 Tax=Nocardioides donggukensis TaxID=2774019 RepID=A0A927K6C2_9ACTN|nr:class I SAM-dependent methyltransferase [Nocardioides donggukensis]MBD8868646.1 class I SAM-dependent methyltransferase [Nocardioides donggukensis]
MTLSRPVAHLAAVGRRLARARRQRGIVGTLREAGRMVASTRSRRRTARWERRFDSEWGIDTAGIVRLTSLDIESANRDHGVRYQATDPNHFHALVDGLDVDPRDFVFVDVGSGKGRVVVLAARESFARVIGVEFSPDLDAVARRNVARLPPELRRNGRIRLLTMDATEFELPSAPLVLYFFNPFDDAVLQVVLDRIRESASVDPRPIYLLFTGPLSELPAARAELRALGAASHAGVAYEVRL